MVNSTIYQNSSFKNALLYAVLDRVNISRSIGPNYIVTNVKQTFGQRWDFQLTCDIAGCFGSMVGLFCTVCPVLTDYKPILERIKQQWTEIVATKQTTGSSGGGRQKSWREYPVLLVETFESTSITKEQLIEICERESVLLIFTEDLI